MQKIVLTVQVDWDSDSKMFVASSEDIPGLATEAPTFEKLVERVKAITPELLEMNDALPTEREIPLNFHQNYYESLQVNA